MAEVGQASCNATKETLALVRASHTYLGNFQKCIRAALDNPASLGMPKPVYGSLRLKPERTSSPDQKRYAGGPESRGNPNRISKFVQGRQQDTGRSLHVDDDNIFLPSSHVSIQSAYGVDTDDRTILHAAPLSVTEYRAQILDAQKELLNSHREILELEEDIRKTRIG